jgi:hypothetical protein
MDCTVQISEAPSLPQAVPTWLADLAEAVAAQRFTTGGGTEPVSWAEFVRIKEQLTRSTASDDYARWAKWFFADRSTRAISPNSPVTVPEYVQQRLNENTLWSLREAVRLAPTNALALARLALRVLEQDPNQSPRQRGEADFLSRYAAELQTNNAPVLQIRRDIADKATRLER